MSLCRLNCTISVAARSTPSGLATARYCQEYVPRVWAV